jgi:hypothetical protein
MMSTAEFLQQLKLALAGALLVLGLGWFLAGSRATVVLLFS